MSDRDIIADHGFYEHDFGGGFCYCGVKWPDEEWRDHRQQHATHVADMLRQARTITTRAQLDALPVGSVVVESEVNHAWVKHDLALWHCSCDGTDVEWGASLLMQDSHQPLIVVWRPEDGDQ